MINLSYLYFAIINFLKSIGLKSDDRFYVGAFFFGVLLLTLKIIRQPFKKKELISLSVILLIGLFDYYVGKTTTILFSAISIAALKGLNFKHIVKISIISRIIAFSSIIILSSIGIIENKTIDFWRIDRFIHRYSLGYNHPNTTHMNFTVIILLLLYYYYNNIKLKHCIVIGVLNYVLYLFTQSRTGFFLINISLFTLLLSKNDQLQKVMTIIFRYSFIIFLFGSFAISFLYRPTGIWRILNDFTTGRLRYMHMMVTNYVPGIIGSSHYDNYLTLDNGFLKIFYEGGILAFIWFSFYIEKTLKYLYANNRFPELFLFFLFNLYSTNESVLGSVSVNISLLLIGIVLYSNFSIDKNENPSKIITKKLFTMNHYKY